MQPNDLVLVTGATGYVGKWCVVKLLEKGYRVRGTVRSADKAAQVRATIAAVAPDAVSRLDLVEADILADKGWQEAMQDVVAILHTATVVRADEPRDSSIVVRPAIEGTERILRFARDAGIKRVVLTSSIATVGYGHGHTRGRRTYDETYFTNLENMRWTWAYCLGKTKAEQAAWAYAKTNGLDLTTIHPGAIIGPALDKDASVSVGMVSGLLQNATPALPSNGYSIIDVRDVADMHVSALEKLEAVGQRYLATAEYTPFTKVADILREAYPDRTIVKRTAPDWIIKLVAAFGGPARQIINDIGNEKIFDGRKGEALMGHRYIAAKRSILDTAESVDRLGIKFSMS
ncbi:MAG TPA: NAD-dependent epimerase/dehydratase family protein [Devosia sp.]|nr:NAD-dependent epimerase/dehydratase family protein [Devosia sp.]